MSGGRVARYLRISDDDGRGGDSINSQRKVIDAYLDRLPEQLDGPRVDYIDQGISGTHFHRPAFQRLIRDVRAGLVACVAVKDLSRLGRDYLAVGDWVEQIFPFLGVRFLSAGDGLDTAVGQGAAGGLESALKALVHQSYSADLSRKIASARRTRAALGRPPVAFVPYGYRKEGERVVEDTETSQVVRWLFARRAEGRSGGALARELNRRGIPPPMAAGMAQNRRLSCRALEMAWTPATVGRILSDVRYTGQGRYRTSGGEVLHLPEGFPPLIPPERFRAADGGEKTRNKRLIQVRCGCCGYAVPLRTHRAGSCDYRCRRHWSSGKAPCPTGCWRGEAVEALCRAVSRWLQRCLTPAPPAAQGGLLAYRRGRMGAAPQPEKRELLPCTVVLEGEGRLTLRFPFCL